MNDRNEQGNISKEGKRSRTILQGTQPDQVAVPERLQILSRNTNGYQHKQHGDVSSQTSEFGKINNGQWRTNSSRVVVNSAGKMEIYGNKSDIRVFEKGMDSQCNDYSEYSERTRRSEESERLINIAKRYERFITKEEIERKGRKYPKRTGESVVYLDYPNHIVYKIKDPYAKAALKQDVQPEDIIYEHLVHNFFFPETKLTFVGISEDMGDVRIILSQEFIESIERPSDIEIEHALNEKGFFIENKYSFGNEFVSVTDLEGDNVIKGLDGKIYFIDPIISFKKL